MIARTYLARTLGVAFAVAVLLVDPIQAETYKIDVVHSSVDFSIRHLVGRSKGKFSEFSGTVTYDEKKTEATSINAVIKVASLDTGNEKRDGHLKSGDFFDAEQFPEITFKSTKVVKKDDRLLVTGNLTMHGVTKSIELSVEVLGVGVHPRGNVPIAGFASDITLKRSDYGVNNWTDKAGVLGDEVKVSLLVEALAKE
jgi:polyisoprenoid-binding protein YceI